MSRLMILVTEALSLPALSFAFSVIVLLPSSKPESVVLNFSRPFLFSTALVPKEDFLSWPEAGVRLAVTSLTPLPFSSQ